MDAEGNDSSSVLPIRITVRRWQIPLPDRDRDLLEYALSNASDEIIRRPLPGATVRMRGGAAVFLFVSGRPGGVPSGLEHRCRQLRKAARIHLYADVDVEIGQPVTMRELPPDQEDEPASGPVRGGRPARRRSLANDDDEFLRRILDYIDERLPEQPTREEIAHYVHFHPAYLSRYFRKKTGWSLSEYIVRQRIEYAKELLTRSELRISHVMSRLGYDNLSHFTRTFKKWTGVTPMQFRKKIH